MNINRKPRDERYEVGCLVITIKCSKLCNFWGVLGRTGWHYKQTATHRVIWKLNYHYLSNYFVK